MADIKDSVGEGGANKVHDVALVQAMLRVVKNAKGVPYLSGNYDGSYGKHTKEAITNFQVDNKLAAASAAQVPGKTAPAAVGAKSLPSADVVGKAGPAAVGAKPAPGVEALDKLGLVAKGSATLNKLNASLPDAYKDMMIIENTKTVYLPGSAADAKTSATSVASDLELEIMFRANVSQLVNDMYNQHKIVLWVTSDGRRRTFADQAKVITNDPNATKAGPGESNHNFGQAVDIGFNGLQWVAGDGTLKKDNAWLTVLSPDQTATAEQKAKANAFWEARNAPAQKQSLHSLNFEKIHLQSFVPTLGAAAPLVALLNNVGKMKWQLGQTGTPNIYKSDLGYGGTFYAVGSAIQVWQEKATVTKAIIAQARSEALKKAAMMKGAAAMKAFVPVQEKDIKADEVIQMQKALKNDFVAGDQNWKKWKAF